VVVVVAATAARARQLQGMLGGPGFRVVAEPTSPQETEAAVVLHHPGVVLVDVSLPAGGLETIERIMATVPTPIVVCGAAANDPQTALGAGAVDVIGALDAPPTSPQYVTALRRHVRLASRVRVITHPRARWRTPGLVAAPVADAGVASMAAPLDVPRSYAHSAAVVDRPRGVELVAIGASTGGPPALATILGELPPDFGAPVVVIQHMADGFVEGLVEWLDSVSPLPVTVAQDGERLRPGAVVVAPAGRNVLVHRGMRLELTPPESGQFHAPGIDATFTSVAKACGNRSIGVLLTGMGRDGALGLRRMREAGAVTIGQDEPTSVVFGMPAAAQALDAVEIELPLPEIAKVLVTLLDRTVPPRLGGVR
jgi:two-component system chemotaxis response regulator CheB